jgi:hypothetical protein
MPAIEKAGYTPISPLAKGAELIHAGIIKNIERADLVLCDMSTLNPNVFFEFGIRTAVNKPVCIVKDEKTVSPPFDTGILNYHDYFSELRPWNEHEQLEKLVKHIQESARGSNGQNELWKYFGLSTRAELTLGKATENDKIELLSFKVDGLLRKLEQDRPKTVEVIPEMHEKTLRVGQRVNAVVCKAQDLGVAVLDLKMDALGGIELIVQPKDHNEQNLLSLWAFANDLNIRLVMLRPKLSPPKETKRPAKSSEA